MTTQVWLLRLHEYHQDGPLTVTVITDPAVWAWLHNHDDHPPQSLAAGYRREQGTGGVVVEPDRGTPLTDQEILKELTCYLTPGSYQNDKALAIAACSPAIVNGEDPDGEDPERRVQAYLAEHDYQVVSTYEGLEY
jgi:hypothetical protein